MATLELRPRSATEIVDASFQLLRGNFKSLVTLSVAAQLPVLILKIWIARMGLTAATMSQQIMSMIWPLVGVSLLVGLFTILAYCALTVAVSQVYLGLAVDSGAALSRGFGRFLWAILTYIVLGIGFGVAFAGAAVLAALLPSAARVIVILVLAFVAVVIALRLIALRTVVVLEDVGPIEAIKRALFLGESLIGHMFLASLLGALIYFGIAFVAVLAVTAIGAVISPLKDPSVSAVFQTAALALIYPVIVAIAVVLYYDLRIRKEGFDVEMMSRAVPR